MSLALVTGLAVQAAALILVFQRLGRTWVRHVGAVFITLTVAYHGVGELLIWAFPGQSYYRRFISEREVEPFFLAISGAILLLTFVYLTVLGGPTGSEGDDGERQQAGLRETKSLLRWPLLVALVAPLALWTIQGRGVLASAGYLEGSTQRQSLTGGLASQFLMPLLVLTVVALVLRFGRKAAVPAFVGQCVILAAAGQRSEVIAGAVIFVYAMARIGERFSRRSIALVLLAAVLLGWVLTAARATEGRSNFTADKGATARFSTIAAGADSLTDQRTIDELKLTAGYRLDGNSFGAMEYAEIREGRPPIGLQTVVNDVLLTVPSAVNPDKVNSSLEDRSARFYAQRHFGLPVTDILVTQLGGTVGFLGIWSLLLSAVLFGLALASIDRLLRGPLSPLKLLVGVGAMSAVVFYERGLEAWTLTARGILLLAIVLGLFQFIRRSFEAKHGGRRTEDRRGSGDPQPESPRRRATPTPALPRSRTR